MARDGDGDVRSRPTASSVSADTRCTGRLQSSSSHRVTGSCCLLDARVLASSGFTGRGQDKLDRPTGGRLVRPLESWTATAVVPGGVSSLGAVLGRNLGVCRVWQPGQAMMLRGVEDGEIGRLLPMGQDGCQSRVAHVRARLLVSDLFCVAARWTSPRLHDARLQRHLHSGRSRWGHQAAKKSCPLDYRRRSGEVGSTSDCHQWLDIQSLPRCPSERQGRLTLARGAIIDDHDEA